MKTVFANMMDVLQFRAQDTPDRVAVYDADCDISYTWKALRDRADRMSAFLVEEVGLRRGDRVAVICGNDPYVVDLFFASCQTGIIIDVLNPHLMVAELSHMVESEKPRALFFAKQYEAKALGLAVNLKTSCAPVCLDGACELGYGARDIDEYRPAGTFVPCRPDFEDIQMLLHTGGTTGFPKAAMLSYRYFLMNAVAETGSWNLTEDDSVYAAMPFFHTAGWNVSMIPVFYAGGRVTLTRDFSPEVLLDLVEAGHLSIFMGADAVLRMVAENPRFSATDFSQVRLLCCGASTVSQASLDAFWSHDLRLVMGYGMTEYGPNAICPGIGFSAVRNKEKPFILGKPLMFTQVRIVRADGGDANVGEEGELYLRGALAFSGYWENEEATCAAFDEGWIKSGDIAYRDEEGQITLCGRRKIMYISGGENVFPIEVERCLESYPGVKEACVIGVPDDKWGEVGKAIVVVDNGDTVTRDRLAQWLEERLSTIKRPHYYAFAEAIPVNPVGKRDFSEIRKRYGQPADGSLPLAAEGRGSRGFDCASS